MRQRLRAAGLFALAIVAITCTDAPTSPTKIKPAVTGVANIRMAPSFSPEAARIYSGLAAFGLEVTEVHIILTGPDGSKKDTVIAFPASQDQITIEIPVPPSGIDQAFDALIELRNSQHVVLFSGRQTVVARAANLPPQTPPLVVISYTGPGKGAKTVTFSPPDTTIAGSATVAIKATAVDSTGSPVPNLLVRFAVSDATLAVATSTGDATGTLTGLGKRGVATVSAITPLGISGSSRITFVPPAARIVVISGGGQSGVAGSTLALPLVVEVQATDNLPVPGATITFRAVTPGGSVQRATAVADANGRASSTLTLGTIAGAYVYEAGSGALSPVSVSATATPAPAAAIAIVSGDAQTDTIGKTLPQPLVVKVTDQFGGAVTGATVTWARTAGNGTPSASTTTTLATGTSSITYTLGAAASNDTIRASVAGVAAGVLFSANAVNRGPSAIAIVSGGNQSGLPNTLLATPLVARVSDAQNTPVANATVTWSATGAGATFNPASSTTDALGQVSTQATLGASSGATTVTAIVGAVSTTTTLTTNAPPQNHFAFQQAPPSQFVIGAAPVTVSVRLLDQTNDPVAQSGIVATLTGTASPGPNFPVLTATTDNTGAATFTLPTYNGAPGTVTLSVSATGIISAQSAAIPIVAASATQLLINTQPSATAVNNATFAQQPVVQLADAQGSPVNTAGVVVTATFASGPTTPTPVLTNATATTNASGRATFAGMSINGAFGAYTLSFSAPNLTSVVSNTITVGAGPANTLLLFGGNGQNALVNTAVAVPPLVKVIDAQSNGVAGMPVTFTVVTAGSTVSDGTTVGPSVTINTNSLGVAQLAAWTMSPTAGPHSLTAAASVPNGSPVTFTANALAAAGSKFVLVQPLPTQIAVATAITPIQIQIADANGNAVAQAGVGVTLTGNVQPSGQGFSISSTTNAQGIVTLQATPYTGTVGTLTLTISASGYTPLISSPIQVVAGPASALNITTQPSTTAQSGVALVTQPVVRVVDQGVNTVLTAGTPVTATVTGATLSGTTTVNTNASGVATFTNLALAGAAGPYTLMFTSPSLNSATSGTIDLSAGPAASMSIFAGQGQTAPAGGMVQILPAVIVKDAGGNPVAGVDVTFAAVTQGSYIDDVTNKVITTNAQGVAAAQFFWMLSGTAGANNLTVTAAGVTPSTVTFTAQGTPGPASNLQVLSAVPASITVGQPFPAPVQVQLVDDNNNPVSQGGVVITATGSVQPSNTTFALSATTSSNGIATFSLPPYVGKIGTMVFTLTAPNINTLVTPGITVLTGAASQVVINTQPPTSVVSGVAFNPQPDVQITDVGSNPVSTSANIAASIASGSGALGGTTNIATNASGQGTFTNLSLSGAPGSFTLRFASVALTAAVSNTIALTPGGPAAIITAGGNGQTVAAGTAVPVAPSVQVSDASGNPLSGITVTFTPLSGGGSVTGGTAVTNASGIATVGSWTLGPSTGANNLSASTGALAVTIQATAIAGPASKLLFTTLPSATASSGTALAQQPVVQRVDQFDNPVAGAGAVITASILSGTGTLTNVTATAGTGGLATFSGLTITGAAGTFTLNFASPGMTTLVSPAITLGSAAAANIVFGVQPTGGTGGQALSPALTVRLVDASGNTVANNSNTVTLTVKGGTAGATLTGGGPITFVNGVATFPSATIDFGGNGYFLDAATNALNQAGAPITGISSSTFNIQPGTSQLLTTKAGTRVSVSAVGAAQNPPSITAPVFVAKNAQGAPAAGLTVDVTAYGRCRLDNGQGLFTTLSYSSDANGEVKPIVRLPTSVDGSGCLIKAKGPTFTTSSDSSKIAVFPAQTSHVWTGEANSNWQNAANWIPVISVPNVPSSTSDNVFIPNYNPLGIPMTPVVSGAKPSMNKLTLDSLASLDLNNIGIDIGGGGVAGFGKTISGSIHIQTSASVNGVFDILDVGQSGSCGAAAPMQAHLVIVQATVLNVRCHTFVDTGVVATTANVFPNAGQGWLHLASGSGGLIAGTANFTGDSLWVLGGGITVTGTATFGGGGVSWSNASLIAQGNAMFNSNHAFYNGAQILVQGDATFGDPNTGQQQFAGGQLTLKGNFTQVTGVIGGPGGLTFSTSSDHATVFAGSTPQTVSFANPTTSRFSVLKLQNSSAGGVQLTTNAQIINGTTQPRVDLLTGRLQIDAGSLFTVSSGGMKLGPSTNLNLLGNITGVGTCAGRTTNSATITGLGLFNGTAYSPATCTP